LLLELTTTHQPATDLGFLLHKNPARVHSFELAFGQAHVFYPEATSVRCTAVLLLDVDPVGLIRGKRGPRGEGGLLQHYVSDRPYVASSFLSVAIARVFGSALKGVSKERPDLAAEPIGLEATVVAVPCRGGEDFLRRLFEPLDYQVKAEAQPLDSKFPEWGPSRYFRVTLSTTKRLSELLGHLYVLVPVLDDEKHYWVTQDEVVKLLRYGTGWLSSHPERELIATRYLKHQRSLVREALARLVVEEQPDPDEADEAREAEEAALERPLSLNEQRLGAALSVLKGSGAKRVLDLGCGEGKLVQLLLADRQFEEIVGMDVSWRTLEIAAGRLKLDRLAPAQRNRVRLIHGSLVYRDVRLTGYDAAAVVEVIEHLDRPRLAAFERVVFESARPGTVVVTTPNAEYNVKWKGLPAGKFRHRDHRFEWTREQFQTWATQVAGRFEYAVRFLPVGDVDPVVGAPTQMGVFTR
jgi:3' terminal RNA ribose 2'-O-methyltransferase Hen1